MFTDVCIHLYTCSTPALAQNAGSALCHSANPPLRPLPTMMSSSRYAYRKKGSPFWSLRRQRCSPGRCQKWHSSLPVSGGALVRARARHVQRTLRPSATHLGSLWAMGGESLFRGMATRPPSRLTHIVSTSNVSRRPSIAKGPLKVRLATGPRNLRVPSQGQCVQHLLLSNVGVSAQRAAISQAPGVLPAGFSSAPGMRAARAFASRVRRTLTLRSQRCHLQTFERP